MLAQKGLNTQQIEAVNTTEGPLLILAGAGAGKTKTITHRILNLIEKGIDPTNILAITFTNKAAKEMKERVDILLKHPNNTTKPFISTFHSLCVSILKEFGGIRHFTIYDKNDSKQTIKDAMNTLGYDPKVIEPNKILSIISKEKGNYRDVEEYIDTHKDSQFSTIVSSVWKKYSETLKKEKALDFDDLIFNTVVLLRDNQNVREYYQNKFKYIHIDEYQDTNIIQYELVKLLVGKNNNIAVVGDIDQAIYSWRGANIKNILRFEEDYPNTKIILLEENYRSTKTILPVANKIIEKNIYRKEKNLFTNNEDGEQITLYPAFDENDEANFISNTARELIEGGVKPSEIAVLYRTNSQSRVLEESFLRKNIKYHLLGTRFFERREVKDVLSYIRASLNRDSMADIKRIINTPTRGIGPVSLIKIAENTGR